MLHCPINVSEGRDGDALDEIARAAGTTLLDTHSDPFHHRSVLTLGGDPPAVAEAARAVARSVVASVDLSGHLGVHPRIGALDVVPFVPLKSDGAGRAGLVDDDLAPVALAVRDQFARWLADALGVPSFRYGPQAPGDRTLPELRRRAFRPDPPDHGPPDPHPTAGATAVGARHALVAYNVEVEGGDLELARAVASAVRAPGVRALGLDVGGRPQVSMNLTEPFRLGPSVAFDMVAERLAAAGAGVARAELVGLLPRIVLEAVPAHRRAELGLAGEPTIEGRLEGRGFSWR